MARLNVIVRRAKDILIAEGPAALIIRGWDLLSQRLFFIKYYYLYEHTIVERSEDDYLPRIHDFHINIVTRDEEANTLAEVTGYDFRSRFIDGQERLDKGAIAFCVIVNGEFAHIGWVATCQEAKDALDGRPYRVEFANGQACTGGTYTIPKYRGKGLMVFSYYKRFEFLREIGFTGSRNVVSTSNIASQKAHSKFKPKTLAKARHMKLCWWESWKETPILEAGK